MHIELYIKENDPLFLQEYDIALKEEAIFQEKMFTGGPGSLRSLVDRKGEHVFGISPVINFPWQEDEYYSEIDRDFDAILLLQPTTPLRKIETLKKAVTRFKKNNGELFKLLKRYFKLSVL